MKRTMIDLAWWYWLLTVGLLATGIAGWPWGIPLAMVLCGIHILQFIMRTGSITSLPVQVRATYLLLLALGLGTSLEWIHFVQVIGTSARVLVGYCLLARTLSLAPWNRIAPLSATLVRSTFVSMQPTIASCGSILQRPSFEA